jgi:addiction module HigA family antidote
MNPNPPPYPGKVLQKEMLDAGLTAESLADLLKVSAKRLNQVLTGEKALGVEIAVRLGRLFGCRPQRWLELQNDYDLAFIQRDQIQLEITPLARSANGKLDPHRPGYAETEAASLLPVDSELWLDYMHLVKMPLWTLLGVQLTARARLWRIAHDPLKSVRESGLRKAIRMGLTDPSVPKISLGARRRSAMRLAEDYQEGKPAAPKVHLACNGDQE